MDGAKAGSRSSRSAVVLFVRTVVTRLGCGGHSHPGLPQNGVRIFGVQRHIVNSLAREGDKRKGADSTPRPSCEPAATGKCGPPRYAVRRGLARCWLLWSIPTLAAGLNLAFGLMRCKLQAPFRRASIAFTKEQNSGGGFRVLRLAASRRVSGSAGLVPAPRRPVLLAAGRIRPFVCTRNGKPVPFWIVK